jgi:predicted porin
MKLNKYFALGAIAATTACVCGSALAQSNVTIYGRLNTSVERQKGANGKSLWIEQNNSSRFGFKGTEDIGGGVKAGFQLESGFSSDTGATTSTFFNRQAEVNLSDSSLGMVRLGHFTAESYYATADFVSNHNHDTGTSADVLYAGFARTDNTVAYRAPTLVTGLSMEVARALSEGVPGKRATTDFAANYQAGPLALGLGYNTYGTTAHQVAVRGYYNIGPFGFGGYVQRDKDTFGVNTGSRTNVRLSGMYTMGASEFHLNGGSAGKAGTIANSKAQQYTVAYNYNLSKRTKVYTFYTKVNDGNAALYGGDFSSLAVGLRHNF